MENEAPTAEQLVPDIEKRKKSLKNFFFGWITTNYDKLFLIVLLAAFIIRILVYTKTQDQALWWDAADYMASAKRWGLGLDTIDIWYYRRGFLWPLIGALFFKLGLGELSIRFLVVLLSTGIVFVTYQLIATMFDKRLALLTSIPVAFSWVFIFFTGRLLTNLPSTFFLLTAILFFWNGYMEDKGKKYFILFGFFYAFACLIRMQYLMFSFSFLAMAIVKEKWKFIINKYLWLSILIFIIIFTPQLINHNTHFGNPIADLSKYYLGIGDSKSGEVGVVSTGFSDYFYYFRNIPYILDANQLGYSNLFVISPFYILFIIGFFTFFTDLFMGFDKVFKYRYLQKKFFILVLILSLFSFMGYIAGQHIEQRYVMPGLPFLLLIAVYPLYLLVPIIRNNLKLKTIWIVILISASLFLLSIPNYQFGNDLVNSKSASYIEVKQAGEWIKANSEPQDIVIGSGLPQLSYYSERSVYPFELAYRRDLEKKNLEELEKFIEDEKPTFLVASAYESEEEWARTFPETHQHMLTAVAGFPATDQPRVIVFRFDYSPIN